MSETELSVVCKNCGSEVSPYVTECPYCGARIRKRAPKLERRGDVLEPKLGRRERRARERGKREWPGGEDEGRPWATIGIAAISSVMLLLLVASGDDFNTYGGLLAPGATDAWRYITAPFTYSNVGYWFVVMLALVIFGPGLERRLGTLRTAVLLVACGSLGMLAAVGIENAGDNFALIAGGNGIALGALAAWFVIRRAETKTAVDDDFDRTGVAIAALVLLFLPVFESSGSANLFAGLAGGAVGALAGLAAARFRPS